ncbi:hypothetical protein DFH11DRAFT_1883456 [Phellopilus nigrolimitatus]|nr:hypothetical protein DFH11DRAFT_1883456 [Phellopilus nigrolimitatus]
MRTARIAVLGLCRTAIKTTSATIISSACQVRQTETTQRKHGGAATAQYISYSLYKALSAASTNCFIYRDILCATHHGYDPTMSFITRVILQKLSHRLLGTVTVTPHATPTACRYTSGRAIAKTSLVVDELRRDLVRARGNLAAEGESARARSLSRKSEVDYKVIATGSSSWPCPTRHLQPAVANKVRNVRGLFHQLTDADGRRNHGVLLALLDLEKRACENGFGSDFEPQDGLLSLIKLGSAVGSVCFSTSVARPSYGKLCRRLL